MFFYLFSSLLLFFLSLSCFIFHLSLLWSAAERERERIGARRERGEEQFALAQEIYVRWTLIHFFAWREGLLSYLESSKCKNKQDITIVCISALLKVTEVNKFQFGLIPILKS
jgi:hypothetical protein